MILNKLKDVSFMFLGLLEELPDTEIGHATLILQELIQLSMLRLSKGKIQNVIFDPVSDTEVVARNVDSAGSTGVEEKKPTNEGYDVLVPSVLIEHVDNNPDAEMASPAQGSAAVGATEEAGPVQTEVKPITQLLVLDKQFVTQTQPDGEVVFICSLCMRKFKDKSNLMRHLRMHAGDRPYACSFCGRQFTQKVHCQVHERSHTGERPFPCAVCGKTFSSHRTLHKHRVVHTRERPYKCDQCGRGFAFKDKLAFHQLIHTGAMPYQCQVCQRRFRWPDSVKKHKCPGEPSPHKAKSASRRTKKPQVLEDTKSTTDMIVKDEAGTASKMVVSDISLAACSNKSEKSMCNASAQPEKESIHPLDSVASIVLKNNRCLAAAIPHRKKRSSQIKLKGETLSKNTQKDKQQKPEQEDLDLVLAPTCDEIQKSCEQTAAKTRQSKTAANTLFQSQDSMRERTKLSNQKLPLGDTRPRDSVSSKSLSVETITCSITENSVEDGVIKTEKTVALGTRGIQDLFSELNNGTKVLAVTNQGQESKEPQEQTKVSGTQPVEMSQGEDTGMVAVEDDVMETEDGVSMQAAGESFLGVPPINSQTQSYGTVILDEHGNSLNTQMPASNTLIIDEQGNLTLESLAALPQGVPIQIVNGEEFLTVNKLADIAHITDQGMNYVVLETFDETQQP